MKHNYELKPCPFCGGQVIAKTSTNILGEPWFIIACRNIDCSVKPSTPGSPHKDVTIASWNFRAKTRRPIK